MPSRTSITATLFGIGSAIAAAIAITLWDQALDAREFARLDAAPLTSAESGAGSCG